LEIKFESTGVAALINRLQSGRIRQDSARMLRTAGLLCAVVTSVAACSSDSSTDPVPAPSDDATNTDTDAAQDGDSQDGSTTQDEDGQDGNTTQDEGNGGVSPADTQELTARITTRYESPETLEAWSCVPSSGPLYLYQFYATGSGPDENSEQMGVVIRSGDFDDDNRQGFGWGATAPDALLLDIPEQGVQIDWTSIKFESDQLVNVHSSIRGNMRCSRIEN
jgi:hypothetical protein